MFVRIPPKYSVSEIMGYLKGKSSLMIFERHANLKYKYGNRHFWCRGYYVDTVGKNAKKIEEYIRNQLKEDLEYATDEKVLENLHNRKEYSKTILKILAINNGISCPVPNICGKKEELERRFEKMKNKKVDNKFGALIIAFAVFSMSLITISLASERYNNLDVEDANTNVTDEIVATADGKVIFADYNGTRGNTVKIEHADGNTSVYSHGSKILVKAGDSVKAGDVIMTVGSTGMATGPHLHFEIINAQGEYVDVNQMFESK